MCQGQDDEQAVNRFSGTDHKGFEAHIHFLLLKHDLNFPAMSVMTQDCFIRQAAIRANEHTQRIFISKRTLWVV